MKKEQLFNRKRKLFKIAFFKISVKNYVFQLKIIKIAYFFTNFIWYVNAVKQDPVLLNGYKFL